MKIKNVLIVSSDFPYPPNHGGRVDIWGRIRSLNSLGIEVDLVSTVKEEPSITEISEAQKVISKIDILQRSLSFKDFLSMLPFQIRSRKSLANITIEKKYDVVILESEYVYAILDNPEITSQYILLRVHNNEVVYYKALARSVKWGVKKLFYYSEAIKFAYLKYFSKYKVKNMMFISYDEWETFRKKNRDVNSCFLPTALEDHIFLKPSLESKNVLFIGSLFMDNNQEALRWYLHKVHPLLMDIVDYQLIIAGNSRNQNLDWLYDLICNSSNIKVYESPKELNSLYLQSSVFINPMLHGAGVKVKTINAIKNGVPVVSTSVGNEGTGLVNNRHILIANEPQAFAQNIKKILLNPVKREQIVIEAQKFLKENYNHDRNITRFFASLE